MLSLLFLDYDFGDIFPVLQSLPSADWEGGTLVKRPPPNDLSFRLSVCPIWHDHATVHAYAYCTLGILLTCN